MTDVRPPTPRRVRPAVRRVAIVAVVVLVPVVAHSLWDYIELRRLVREINDIRAKGEPVTELEAAGGYRRMTEEQEVAGRLFIAAGLVGYPVASKHRENLGPFWEFVAGAPRPGFDLSATAGRFREAVAEGRIALDHADRAVTLPFYGFPPGTSYSYRTSELVAFLNLQSIRTAHYGLEGDGDAAARSALAQLKTRKALSEPIAWWWLSSRAPDISTILSFSTPSTDSLRALLKEMQAQDRPDAVEKGALIERAAFVERTFREFYGGDPHAAHAYRLPYRGIGHVLWRPLFTHNFVRALQGWKQLIVASRKPWPDKGREMSAIAEAHFEAPREQSQGPRRRYWLFPTQFDFVLRYRPHPARLHFVAQERAAQVALAVALYRADHGGELPETLDALRPAYLAEVPQDPASSSALLYRKEPNAFTIYSVGSDGRDDGGDLTSDLTKRVPRRLGGADIGIRVLINGSTKETR